MTAVEWVEYPCRFCGEVRRPAELFVVHIPGCPFELRDVPMALRDVYRLVLIPPPREPVEAEAQVGQALADFERPDGEAAIREWWWTGMRTPAETPEPRRPRRIHR